MHEAEVGTREDGRAGAGVKRLIDIVGALVFIIVFLPLLLAVALGVLLSSRGPIIYSQERLGLNGKKFRFYKFRSMVVNSEEVFNSFLDTDPEAKSQWEKYQKLDRDPRITGFGHFIRKTSLDEFPQFWNVLVGDMSLVGPRPCMPSQRELYGVHWREYCAVRPGLTGLWQVSGRNQLTYQQRVQLDSKYVMGWSLSLDFQILARTVKVVLTANGSR
ncbi:sugar transferase [Ramlibacter alkalitolerans]|uniref:Sugar transferase n=1 Tax=Ramlibacter alkalitolerans TaxID=2039631 RepID=A0ABS1JWV2_9BURK|nr:sugar transferase [Ramlibacter alkalitolerans]MBL0428677.1 sugar transferase [Ramlibacter alkalitolerans]